MPPGNTGVVPVAQTNPRRAVLIGLAVIVLAAGLIAVVLVANGARSSDSGGGVFDSVDAEELLRLQQRDDAPALFPDPVGGRQPVFVWNTGDDPAEGWVAYDALYRGEPIQIDRDEGVLRADADGTEFPFDGEGLPHYEVEVVDGRLEIDLAGD